MAFASWSIATERFILIDAGPAMPTHISIQLQSPTTDRRATYRSRRPAFIEYNRFVACSARRVYVVEL